MLTARANRTEGSPRSTDRGRPGPGRCHRHVRRHAYPRAGTFERRRRAFTGDALEDSRLIGMVRPQPGDEAGHAGRPPIFPIECAGVIPQGQQLPNGQPSGPPGIVTRHRPGAPFSFATRGLAQTRGGVDVLLNAPPVQRPV